MRIIMKSNGEKTEFKPMRLMEAHAHACGSGRAGGCAYSEGDEVHVYFEHDYRAWCDLVMSRAEAEKVSAFLQEVLKHPPPRSVDL